MSERLDINEEELKKWIMNSFRFLAPAIVLYIGIIKIGGTYEEANSALYLWILNVIYDFAWKYIPETKNS